MKELADVEAISSLTRKAHPVNLGRKSLRLCLAGLWIGWFDPIAEVSELPDHSRSALLL